MLNPLADPVKLSPFANPNVITAARSGVDQSPST